MWVMPWDGDARRTRGVENISDQKWGKESTQTACLRDVLRLTPYPHL